MITDNFLDILYPRYCDSPGVDPGEKFICMGYTPILHIGPMSQVFGKFVYLQHAGPQEYLR